MTDNVTSEGSDQTALKCSLIKAFACHHCSIVLKSHGVAHFLYSYGYKLDTNIKDYQIICREGLHNSACCFHVIMPPW